MSRYRRPVLWLAPVTAVLTALLSTGGPAMAAGDRLLIDVPNDRVGFTTSPGGALLDTGRFAPGRSTAATFGVRNGSGAAGRLTVAAVAVRDDDNGCARTERLVDTGCGAGQGELGARLVTSLAVAGDRDGRLADVWRGSLLDLRRGAAVEPAMAAHATRYLRLSVELPQWSGNETQTDGVTFDLRLTLDGAGGAQSTVISGGSSGRSGSPLPVTGPVARALAAVGGAALLLGTVLLIAVRTTTRSRPARPRLARRRPAR